MNNMYKEFNDYYPENEMNNDKDLFNLVNEMSSCIEKYIPKIDTDNLLAILIGFCKQIGDEKGIKKKEFKRGLKNIIDLQI